ncbi:ABC transporter substrate-binding protein [uncultured Alteromonas sp.]|jgi:hypothetical protein|uniref:substrate-binding periplasmic protein n=1 Tax=uncultured Alteromonas sp. TaxID=179113 RepID=UPI0025E9DA0D|nr:transporter substrate-binding domain-containing protein [uncultured Alteromonas sp.]
MQISGVVRSLVSVGLVLLTFSAGAQSPITLVANPLPTLVSEGSENARLNQLVEQAFIELGVNVELAVDRPAFSGSGLLTGKYDGEFAHFGLQERRNNLLYSKAYLPALLYVASRKYPLDDVTQFSHIRNSRVATTNRIANTPAMRNIKAVSWVRNPTLYDMFSQLSEKRADYVFEDWLVLTEFNRMLTNDGEKPLFVSPNPLVSSAMVLSLRKDYPNAQQVLDSFDSYIRDIQRDGRFNQAMAVGWTSMDINGDGTADWITSAQMHHDDVPPMSQKGVLPLDKTQPGEASLFVIDGEQFTSWPDAQAKLNDQPVLPRPTLLDREIYKRMLQRW